jgi:hypothetical protein
MPTIDAAPMAGGAAARFNHVALRRVNVSKVCGGSARLPGALDASAGEWKMKIQSSRIGKNGPVEANCFHRPAPTK